MRMKHHYPQVSFSFKATAFAAAFSVAAATANFASDTPESVRYLRPVNLDVQMRVDARHDIALRLEPSQEPLGRQLDSHQMWKLDQIRREIPQKFRYLQNMFPRQIAEYLLRQGGDLPSGETSSGSGRGDVSTEVATHIAERYLTEPLATGFTDEQLRARHEFVTKAARNLAPENAALLAVLESCARYSDPDFSTAKKANAFAALKQQYSPYKDLAMSVAGDTLLIGGKVVTDRLRTDAAVAGSTPEQYAQTRHAELSRNLAEWRAAQISGDAYAGTIKSFLNDPRLADFTPEEIHRAYARIFGRDLKTDVAADRRAAKEGRLFTYAEMTTPNP